jgi:hypothetical protein
MSGEKVNDEKAHPPAKDDLADDLVDVDNLEIAPLSEEDLDTVVGGVGPLDSDCTSRDASFRQAKDGRFAT